MKRILFASLAFVAGCASTGQLRDPAIFSSDWCRIHYREHMNEDTDQQLDHVYELFQHQCANEVVEMGRFVRSQRRDKFYSVSAEVAELVTPEGTFSPYVLESYERSFLSLLISLSYLQVDRVDDALVELRRTIREENAWLYNQGEDPVITLLLAALWDRFDPGISRPQWKRLSEFKTVDSEVREFALARLRQLDQAPDEKVKWKIYAIGELPQLDWQPRFFEAHPYKVRAKSAFPFVCSTGQSLLLPTSAWLKKIGRRYDSDYHPLVFTKSLLRLPVGLTYGFLGISSGMAIGVGGCVAAAKADDRTGELCKGSIELGGYLIQKSADLVEFTLAPDLRHWENLPSAIAISRDSAPGCMVGDASSEPETTLIE